MNLLPVRVSRVARLLRAGLRALADRHHPVMVQIVAMRRCNLSCTYCSEFDGVSAPVPLEKLRRRLDRLAELGTSIVTLSGGEPLLHPQVDELVAHIRRRGMLATLITNGYLLSPERIASLNRAGLDHLQISIDNVEPDETSKKSLRLLEPKLQWLARLARFEVNINSVVGGFKSPGDAVVIAKRARQLGFGSSIGIIHDHGGQLKGLSPADSDVYRELRRLHRFRLGRINDLWQSRLADGEPNDWHCRAGARYLYVDEFGFVQYCSQQRGALGIPLETYGREDVRREYDSRKPCAAYCTINCVHQASVLDGWRRPQNRGIPFLPERGPAES